MDEKKVSKEKRVVVTGPDVAAEIVRGEIENFHQEHLFVLLLSSNKELLRVALVSLGTLTSSLVHPREVFRPAVAEPCYGVALAHNHPSGDPAPSDEDVECTRRLIEAGRLLGIKVFDHVIVTRDDFYSMEKAGGLEF